MIQTQTDRSFWHLHNNPYSSHYRSLGYTSPQHSPVHHSSLHHAPLHHSSVHHSSVHHAPISPTHHSSHLLHSSYTTSTPSINQFTHTQPQGAPEPRSMVERDIHQYDSLVQSQALDGFPTRPQFEELLNEYILSLSPKKRDKALIPQKRYDNILAVLKDPKCTTIESAQFRFWAKKMFRLSNEDNNGSIVCHEGKPVAVREQLYQVLTESHNRAQHGGRDKTSAEVRKHYSWVPKELIARFVRHCPSCTLRRSSPLDYPIPSRSQDSYSKLDMSPSPPYNKSMEAMGAPSPPYSNASSPSSGMSPIHRHPSTDSLSSSIHSVPVSSQSMPQLQAMTGGVMMATANGSSDVAYQYTYGSGIGETTGSGLVTVPSMESPGIYSRGTN